MDLSLRALSEFIGTFILCLTVGCCVSVGTSLQAIGVTAIGLSLTVSVYALARVSGAHLNPAVTCAQLACGCITGQTAAVYIGVQVAAGLLVGPIVWFITGSRVGLGPAEGFSWWQVGISEILYTFMLCFVVLNVACVKQRDRNQFFGIAIGFVVIAGGYAVGGISGAAFNPAVAASFMLSAKAHWNCFAWMLAYWGYELVGAALAALLFRLIRPEIFTHSQDLVVVENFPLHAKCVAEFVGTFFLVFTVGCNILGDSGVTPWAAAAALMCMIYALADVSGAHFNPAVTVAVLASRRNLIGGKEAGAFIGMQFLGGILAALAYSGLHRFYTFPLKPADRDTWSDVLFCEMLFTMLLCLVVLTVATRKTVVFKGDLYGLAIATCVTAGGFAVGPVSGGSLNPAVSVAIATANLITEWAGWWACVLYSFAELAGGAAAAGAFMALYPSEYKTGVVR